MLYINHFTIYVHMLYIKPLYYICTYAIYKPLYYICAYAIYKPLYYICTLVILCDKSVVILCLLQFLGIICQVCEIRQHSSFVKTPDTTSVFSTPGIVFEAYSPLGNPGQLKQDNLERSVLDHPDIVEIAKKHSVSAAQVSELPSFQNGVGVSVHTFFQKVTYEVEITRCIGSPCHSACVFVTCY